MRTGQRAQTAFACAICRSAGPEGAMGKNRSGSLSRQAPRDAQPAEASRAAVGTGITGLPFGDRLPVLPGGRGAGGGWIRSSQRRGVAGVARQPDRPVEEAGGCWQLAQYLGADVGAGVTRHAEWARMGRWASGGV